MAKPMTKTQLVAALAEEMGADKKTASTALDAITGIITKEVAEGGAVTLPGVGKIYCRERPDDVLVARYSPAPGINYAMFAGGGVGLAEQLMKQGENTIDRKSVV